MLSSFNHVLRTRADYQDVFLWRYFITRASDRFTLCHLKVENLCHFVVEFMM
tara:strand:+ start:1035 stop:1190 length:156 start_codon:yes stop_codon:yes gene_type:complete